MKLRFWKQFFSRNSRGASKKTKRFWKAIFENYKPGDIVVLRKNFYVLRDLGDLGQIRTGFVAGTRGMIIQIYKGRYRIELETNHPHKGRKPILNTSRAGWFSPA